LAPLQNKSEICTTQLGRPCAPGHQGRWVKKCEGKIREPRQHDQEVSKLQHKPNLVAKKYRKKKFIFN
jgi:hypothetical protein